MDNYGNTNTKRVDPMYEVYRTSEKWVGATIIGYSGDRNHFDIQVRLNDGTVVNVKNGVVKEGYI